MAFESRLSNTALSSLIRQGSLQENGGRIQSLQEHKSDCHGEANKYKGYGADVDSGADANCYPRSQAFGKTRKD